MWQAKKTVFRKNQIIRKSIYQNGQALVFAEFLDLLTHDEPFRAWYNQLLADQEMEAFFWEHPPIDHSTLDKPYEFVLINSPTLARVSPEPQAFAHHFKEPKLVESFPNLGGDAQLVVPAPGPNEAFYTHLGRFVRLAEQEQIQAFWQMVGIVCLDQIKQGRRWLSTAGMGVFWLHIRIDTSPKYYRYREYAVNSR